MSDLHYGLTPKMKPISPRRSALVAALDVGTSKVACLIARLQAASAAGGADAPQPCHRGPRLRPRPGARHESRRRGRSRRRPRKLLRQAVDLAERTAGVQIESVVLSISAGRLGQRAVRRRRRHRRRRPSADGDIARVLAAGSRHSLREGRAVLHSLPIGYSIDGSDGIRDPRGMLGARFGVDMHVATDRRRGGAQSDARGRALPSRRRGHGGEPLRGRPFGAGRRRGRSRRRRGRHGRRHHHHRGLHRRPLRAVGRLRARRPPRHHGHRARTQRPHRRRRAHQDVLRQRARRRLRRARHGHGAAVERRRARSRRNSCRARRSCASSSRASRKFSKWCATGSPPRRSRPSRAGA